MKKFKQYINEHCEESALVEITDDNKVILKGDDYHDHIDDKIDGFFEGLYYCNVDFEKEKPQFITPNNPLFNELDFYDDGSYDE